MTRGPPPAVADAGPLPTGWNAFAGGMRAMLPILVGIAPFGMAIGAAAAGSGMPLAGWPASLLIYSASPQLAAIDLLGTAPRACGRRDGPAINPRLLLYSGMLARWRGTSRGLRVLAGYLLIDPSFIVGTAGYEKDGPPCPGHAHYLGGACLLGSRGSRHVAGSRRRRPSGRAPSRVPGAALPGLPARPEAHLRARTGRPLVGAVAAVAGSLLPLHLGLRRHRRRSRRRHVVTGEVR